MPRNDIKMRKNIVAGNWKMNKTLPQAIELINEITTNKPSNNAEIILATPFPFLTKAVELVTGTDIKIAAQNMHQAEGGAYTGEVSAAMLNKYWSKHSNFRSQRKKSLFS